MYIYVYTYIYTHKSLSLSIYIYIYTPGAFQRRDRGDPGLLRLSRHVCVGVGRRYDAPIEASLPRLGCRSCPPVCMLRFDLDSGR